MRDDNASVLADPDRLAALADTGLLDTPPEEIFDCLAGLARRILNAPAALVTLVHSDRQFFKSCLGLAEPWPTDRESPISHSFCQHAVTQRRPLIIENALDHPLVQDNPAIQDMAIVSYIGVPLITGDGHVLGTLCVVDSKPHAWSDADLATLTDLARHAVTEIELRRLLRHAHEHQEERLVEERQRAMKQLSLGLRHEVNNALTNIMLMTDLLSLPGTSKEEHDRRVEIIQLEAVRIRDVLLRLEDVGALPTGRYATGQPMVDLS